MIKTRDYARLETFLRGVGFPRNCVDYVASSYRNGFETPLLGYGLKQVMV